AAGEEFRHEHCSDVAGAPGHQDRSNVLRHVPFSISRKIGGRTRKRHHRRKMVARARAMFRTLTAFDCPYERSWWIKPTSTYERPRRSASTSISARKKKPLVVVLS